MTKGISIDPAVCHGKPVIEGTRVLLSTILGALAGGDSREMVAQDYDLTLEQICDQVVILQKGSKVYDGNTKGLIDDNASYEIDGDNFTKIIELLIIVIILTQ